MTSASAQDFRNTYEKFYNQFRLYLWPFRVVEDLANVEVNIYTAFPDIEKLKRDLGKLRIPIEDVVEDYDDGELVKLYEELVNTVSDANVEEMFHPLSRVEEVNPNEDKQIKFQEDDDSEGKLEEESSSL